MFKFLVATNLVIIISSSHAGGVVYFVKCGREERKGGGGEGEGEGEMEKGDGGWGGGREEREGGGERERKEGEGRWGNGEGKGEKVRGRGRGGLNCKYSLLQCSFTVHLRASLDGLRISENII